MSSSCVRPMSSPSSSAARIRPLASTSAKKRSTYCARGAVPPAWRAIDEIKSYRVPRDVNHPKRHRDRPEAFEQGWLLVEPLGRARPFLVAHDARRDRPSLELPPNGVGVPGPAPPE